MTSLAVNLGSLTSIKTGKLDANASSEDGEYPFFTCAQKPLRISSYSYDCECVLIAGNGDLNVKYYEGKFDAYQRTYIVEVLSEKRSELHLRYAYHFLETYLETLREQSIGGIIKYIKMGNLTDAKIPLPPLAEQKRIAAILDAADALRTKRRESFAQLDALLQSTFLTLFGDPDREWITTDIAGVALPGSGSIRTGPFGSQLLHSEFTDEGVAVLGIDNAVANEFRWGERRYISGPKYRQLKRYTVRPGDVIITIMGTCGRCAVVPEGIPPAINTKHLCCITLDPAKCLPIFLHSYFLRHPISLGYLRQTAKGAIMSGLNMGLIKGMPVLLPPLPLQQKFAAIVESVERQKAAQRAHLAELDALFASLQHRAFRGEL